jgi:membrane-associated phospholipid phosphatase
LGDTLYQMRVPSRYLPAEATPRTGEARSTKDLLLLLVQASLLLAMTATVATRLWQDHIWIGFALVAVTTAVWLPELSRPRARRWWFAYVAGIFAYTLLRSYADDTGIPIQTMYVIDADHLLFFGNDPVVWLQSHFFTPGRITPLDFATVQVHWSFFVAPHIAAVLIFIWRRDLFPRYTLLVVGTMYLGLALFFLLPTTPPWLAARAGSLPEGFRIMDFVGGRVDGETYRTFSASLGEPNSVAAMPSKHMAVTFAMYLCARDNQRRLAPWLLLYTAIMGFSLIYMAEHYVLDLFAGMACAWLCHLAVKRILGDREPRLSPAPES